MPATQSVHVLEALDVAPRGPKEPFGQMVPAHSVAPLVLEYWPDLQREQMDEFDDVAPGVPNEPGAHSLPVQLPEPKLLLKVPGLQGKHAPEAEVEPFAP